MNEQTIKNLNNKSMKIITLNIPYYMDSEIATLVNELVFPNRSEAIRTFIRDGIIREYELKDKIKSRSNYFEYFKKYIADKEYVALNNLVAGYLSDELGLSKRVNGRKFKSLYVVFSKFIELFKKKGFLAQGHGSRCTYKIIKSISGEITENV